ncbi:MAG: DUF309 domain-containing protein [Thermostichales cyanobacterium BF4_bins_65]
MSLERAIEQFNQEDFYACHDTLEALWLEAGEPERQLYQGLLQVAVGYYHWGHGNRRGCQILLGEGLRKLQAVADLDLPLPLDLVRLVAEVEANLTALHQAQEQIGIPKIDLVFRGRG